MILLDNVDVNSTSTTILGDGGPRVIFIRADDFGGGTVRFQTAPPGDIAIRFRDLFNSVTKEETEIKVDYLPPGTHFRVILSRTRNASNVFVEIT